MKGTCANVDNIGNPNDTSYGNAKIRRRKYSQSLHATGWRPEPSHVAQTIKHQK